MLYTQPGILKDEVPAERKWGIDAGLAWRQVADVTVVYVDRGTSAGMTYGIKAAKLAGKPVEYRTLRERPEGFHGLPHMRVNSPERPDYAV